MLGLWNQHSKVISCGVPRDNSYINFIAELINFSDRYSIAKLGKGSKAFVWDWTSLWRLSILWTNSVNNKLSGTNSNYPESFGKIWTKSPSSDSSLLWMFFFAAVLRASPLLDMKCFQWLVWPSCHLTTVSQNFQEVGLRITVGITILSKEITKNLWKSCCRQMVGIILASKGNVHFDETAIKQHWLSTLKTLEWACARVCSFFLQLLLLQTGYTVTVIFVIFRQQSSDLREFNSRLQGFHLQGVCSSCAKIPNLPLFQMCLLLRIEIATDAVNVT